MQNRSSIGKLFQPGQWVMAGAAAMSAVFTIAVITLPGSAKASQSSSTDVIVPASDGYLEVIEKIAERVWLVRQPEAFHLQPIGNVTLIEQGRGLVLIDSGGSPGSGRRITKLVRSVSSKPVTHIVLTHWHGDHSLGLAGLLEQWPKAMVVASEPTKRALLGSSMERYAKDRPQQDRTVAFLKSLEGPARFVTESLKDPKLTVEERAGFERAERMIPLYRRDVEGLYIPTTITAFKGSLRLADSHAPVELVQPGRANTDGDTVAWLPKQKVLVSGDIVVSPVPFGFGSYPADWIEVIQQLRARNFRVLVPGHGAPQHDRTYLDMLQNVLEEVRAKVAPLAAQGLSLEETRKQLDFSAQRRLFTGSNAWLGRWFDRSWIAPIVEAAWKEAKGLPIEQGKG